MQYIHMHAMHNGCRYDHIRNERTRGPIDFDLDSKKKTKKYRYLSNISCRGLLVEGLSSQAPSTPPYKKIWPAIKYRICNRTTKRIPDLPHPLDHLPRPHRGVIIMRVFLNSSTSSYHVVSLYLDTENKVKFQVIDLGGESNDPCPNDHLSWRTLNIPEYDVQKYDCRGCVLEEGILFIPALRKGVSTKPIIVCVDLVQQACTSLNAPPESLRFENPRFNFQLWRGKPALSLVSEEKLNVWILEDYKTHKWADPILIPLPSLNEDPLLKGQVPQIHQGDEEDFLVYNRYFLCTTRVIGYYVCKIGSKVLSYDETPLPKRVPATLVSVKGMRRPKNIKKRTTI